MTVYTVRVNTKLIHWAIQQSSTQCAISQALLDANEDWQRPWVNQHTIGFSDRRTDTRYTFATPPALADWITQFDQDPSKVKPITFEIDAVKEDAVKRGDRSEHLGASVLRVKPSGRGQTVQEVPAIVKGTQRTTVQKRITEHARYTNRSVRPARTTPMTYRPLPPDHSSS